LVDLLTSCSGSGNPINQRKIKYKKGQREKKEEGKRKKEKQKLKTKNQKLKIKNKE